MVAIVGLCLLAAGCGWGGEVEDTNPPPASANAPVTLGAFATDDGQWYLLSPSDPGRHASSLVCRERGPTMAVSFEGDPMSGEPILLHHYETVTTTPTEAIEGGSPAPRRFIEARRAVGDAWHDGEGCDEAEGEISCQFMEERRAFKAASGGESFNKACYLGSNWVDAFAAKGVGVSTLVEGLVPRWGGHVPYAPRSLFARCVVLSGTAEQQAEAGDELLELVAGEAGETNAVRALWTLGLLQRVGKTETDWLARAEPTSAPGRQCLAFEKKLVADGVTELR